MTERNPAPNIADEVLWSDRVIEYDDRNDPIDLRLLDADAEEIGKNDMARQILGIDLATESDRAHKAVESHLPRTRWVVKAGYRELVENDRPDSEAPSGVSPCPEPSV